VLSVRHLSLLATLILLGLGGPVLAAETVAKVSVLSNGKVLLNGKPTTLASLDAALSSLAASKGVVWYYREAAEPPAVSMQVIELVIKHRLPISLSTKPDFSDAVGPDGRPRRMSGRGDR
jgi:hypothetical protein